MTRDRGPSRAVATGVITAFDGVEAITGDIDTPVGAAATTFADGATP
jgi:hypothetical protein